MSTAKGKTSASRAARAAAFIIILRNSPCKSICLLHRLLEPTGKIRRCLNLGSYNYLGFAAADEYCTPRVLQALTEHGWSMCASRAELGASYTTRF